MYHCYLCLWHDPGLFLNLQGYPVVLTHHHPVATNDNGELSSFHFEHIILWAIFLKRICFWIELPPLPEFVLFTFREKGKRRISVCLLCTFFCRILLTGSSLSFLRTSLLKLGNSAAGSFFWSWAQLSNWPEPLHYGTSDGDKLTRGMDLQCQTHFISARCDAGSPGLQLQCIILVLREANVLHPHRLFFTAIFLICSEFSHSTPCCWLC